MLLDARLRGPAQIHWPLFSTVGLVLENRYETHDDFYAHDYYIDQDYSCCFLRVVFDDNNTNAEAVAQEVSKILWILMPDIPAVVVDDVTCSLPDAMELAWYELVWPHVERFNHLWSLGVLTVEQQQEYDILREELHLRLTFGRDQAEGNVARFNQRISELLELP